MDQRARRRAAWRILGRTLRRQRRALVASTIGGFGWQLVGIVVPVVLGWTVDRGIEGRDRGAVWLGGLFLVALGGVEAACAALRHRMASTAYAHGAADLRGQLVAAALELDEDGRDALPPGEVVARTTSDADIVATLLDAVGHTVAHAVAVPVVAVLLLLIDPVLAAVVIATIPVTVLLMWRYSSVWERRSAHAQAAVGTTSSSAQEVLEGFKTIRGLGAERGAMVRYEGRSVELRDRSAALGRLWMWFEPALESLSVLSVAAVLWIGGNRTIDGRVGLGGVVTAVGFVLFLSGPVRTLGERVLTVQGALASAERLVDLLDSPHARVDRSASAAGRLDGDADFIGPSRRHLALEADGVGFSYLSRPSDRVLDRVSVKLVPGQVVLLRGPVGSGKSTLLALLAGLRRPSTGDVRLGGRSLAEWPSDLLRTHVLLMGPVPFLFAGTIADNLRFADPSVTPEQMEAAAHLVDAASFIDGLPERYDTTLGERGVTLSGGQRQRLALARSVLASPAILLLDGATSALDPTREAAIVSRLATHLEKGILVVVSPNSLIEGVAGTVLALRGGAIEVRT